MANYTEYYHLHQWEPEDSFLRMDFNEDFAKLIRRSQRGETASRWSELTQETAITGREGDGSALPLPAAGGHGGGRELPGDLALPAAGDKGCGQ